jgi:hypothetical protein
VKELVPEPSMSSDFPNPNILVNVNSLNQFFAIWRKGCPLDFCRKPFESHSLRVDGVGAKATFTCKKGHPTPWTSCDQLGRQALVLNRLMPCAAVMTGLKITPTKRFLGLMEVDSQGASYMKSTAIDILARLTNEMYVEEIARVRNDMLQSATFDLGMQQHWIDFYYYYYYYYCLIFSTNIIFIFYLRFYWFLSLFSCPGLLLTCSYGRATFTLAEEVWSRSFLHCDISERQEFDLRDDQCR